MSAMSNFDDFTKKELGNYSPDVPPHIWDNIVAERKKKKPPYPFLYKLFNKQNLLLVAGIIALLTGSFYIFNSDKKTQLTKNDSATQQSSEKKQSEINALKKVPEDSPDNTDKNIVHNSIPSPGNVTNQDEVVISSNKKVANNNSSFTLSERTALQGEGDKSNHNLTTVTGNRSRKSYKKGNTTIYNNNAAAEDIVNKGSSEVTNASEKYQPAEHNALTPLLLFPEKLSEEDLRGARLNTSMLSNIQSPPCPAVERNAAGNKYYIELYAGPDYASKHFSDTANSALLQKRKESMAFRSAFSVGFRYTRVFNNGASIRAGINYSQVNEKFSYVQSNITQITYITDPVTGDTTGTFLTSGTRYKTTNNKYHTIDIPLLLGFETGNGRIHANFNAGVVLNIYSWQKGESLDTSFRPVNISTGKGASLYQYKTNIGAGFMGGVSVYYKLNDQLHLLAEPYLRYNFSPMNKEMLSLQEKFTTIGLRLGIRLDLN